METILLAGASGALGRAVYSELQARKYKVKRLVRAASLPNDWAADLRHASQLRGACESVDIVISCAGACMTLSNWSNRAGFREVDYLGNLNLLEEAKRSGVRKFVYVSLNGGPTLLQTAYAKWHEEFAGALSRSGVDWSVVRPTGLFSFYCELLEMARKGRGAVVDGGEAKTNPIHQADAARACVEAVQSGDREIPVGGPKVYTRRQITEMAFDALGAAPSVRSVPGWALKPVVWMVKPVNARIGGLMEFGIAVSQADCIAPRYGTLRLESYFREMAAGMEQPLSEGHGQVSANLVETHATTNAGLPDRSTCRKR